MNYFMSIFFRLIPLLMGAICFSYGIYVTTLGTALGSGYLVAGHVLISLTAICIALYCTAATIIRQLINRYSSFFKWFLPVLGYAVSLFTVGMGIYYWNLHTINTAYFVSGNIIFGVGLIACCVTTVATSSTRFLFIPANSNKLQPGDKPQGAFSENTAKILIAIPALCALVGLIRSIVLISAGLSSEYFVAGHVLFGTSLVCASLIALVASVIRQIQNTFTDKERWKWTIFVLILGSINVVLGIGILLVQKTPAWIAPGWVLVGLGFICYSISSKVILLASVWRQTFSLAKRIPLIPIMTTLFCLFTAAFLFEAELFNSAFFVPARVMVGLGAVCFTLYSIVSILESGTSGSSE